MGCGNFINQGSVSVCAKVTCFGTANGAFCLCSAGCFAEAVRLEVACFGSANRAGCFLCAGCFAKAMSVGLTVSRAAGRADSCFGTGCASTGAIFGLFMLIVTRTYSGVRAVTVRRPSPEGVGECRELAVACLPGYKVSDFVLTSLFGVEFTARALVVVFPACFGAGCRLTYDYCSVAVRVRSGAVVATGVTDHIDFVVVNVLAKLILLTAFAGLPMVVVILNPLTKAVGGGGDDEVGVVDGVLINIEVCITACALIVRLHAGCQSILGMGCGNLSYGVTQFVCLERAVFFLTSGADCLLGAGSRSAFAIVGFFMVCGACAEASMCAVTVRIPRSPVMSGGIDFDHQCFFGGSNFVLVKVGVTNGTMIMRFHTGNQTSSICLCHLFAIGVSLGVSVCYVTGRANCRCGAGSLAARTIGSCGVLVIMRADSCMRAVSVGYPITPIVCIGIDCNDQLLLGFDVHIGVKEGVTYRTLVIGLHTCFGASCILLRNVIVIVVVSRANIFASIARGIASVIPNVLDFILNTVLEIGTIWIGTCEPVIGIIVLVSFVIRVGVIDCANGNRIFADYKVCTALVGGITDSNTTNNDLPMREALAFFGSIIAYQLYVATVKLTCDKIAVSINCMAALYRDRNENFQCCALTTVRAIGATRHTVECNNRIVVKGKLLGGYHFETERISLAIFEYGFRSQALVGGVAIPIINDCRILFGICRSNNVRRIFTVCRCNNGEVHLIEQNLVSVKCFDGNCLTCHNKGGGLSACICKGHAACGAFPTCKILAVGSFVCRNGDSFSIARLTHICCTILNGDGMRCVAVNRLNANVARRHYKGGGRCRCIGEHNVFATYNDPTLKRLACLGSVCGDGNCNTAANLGDGDFVNGCAAVFHFEVKG